MLSAESAVADLHLDRGDVGERLDRVLHRHLASRPELSRARIQRLIHGGFVLVNGQAVRRCAQRLRAGDHLELRMFLAPRPARRISTPTFESEVIYEDEDLLAVNKAAGQVVHAARAYPSGTLLDTLCATPGHQLPLHLVSRLDRDTSGVVLLAKRPAVHAALQRAGGSGAFRKVYIAVSVGAVAPRRGLITAAVMRDPGDPRRMQVTDRGGQTSATRWRRLATVGATADGNAGAALSLLECELVTGRTHQIRVHLAAKGWPVLADPRYGVRHTPSIDGGDIDDAVRELRRHALHARMISFTHPATGAPVSIAAPLPEDLARIMHACAWTERV